MDKSKQLSAQELRQIQLSILEKFHNFCNKNNIIYFLSSGSLLGAVRHKGFIPWDDDIDVSMLRSEYNRLIEIYDKNPIDGLSLISEKNNDNSPFPLIKLSDDSTVLCEHAYPYFKYGVYIDIFPIDPMPAGKLSKLKFKILDFICKLGPWFMSAKQKNSKDYKQTRYMLCGTFFKYSFFFLKKNFFLRLYSKIVDSMEQNAEFYSHTVCSVGYKKLPKSLFESQEIVEFEGKKYKTFNNYRKYLEIIYGNYMTPPPPEKRISHHDFEAYRK